MLSSYSAGRRQIHTPSNGAAGSGSIVGRSVSSAANSNGGASSSHHSNIGSATQRRHGGGDRAGAAESTLSNVHKKSYTTSAAAGVAAYRSAGHAGRFSPEANGGNHNCNGNVSTSRAMKPGSPRNGNSIRNGVGADGGSIHSGSHGGSQSTASDSSNGKISTASTTATVANSITEFATQMHAINQTISGALSLQPSHAPNEGAAACAVCLKTSRELEKLQHHARTGLECLGHMTSALERALSQARLAQEALEHMTRMDASAVTEGRGASELKPSENGSRDASPLHPEIDRDGREAASAASAAPAATMAAPRAAPDSHSSMVSRGNVEAQHNDNGENIRIRLTRRPGKEETVLRIRRSTPLQRLFDMYVSREKLDAASMVYLHKGNLADPALNAIDVGLGDNDVIQCLFASELSEGGAGAPAIGGAARDGTVAAAGTGCPPNSLSSGGDLSARNGNDAKLKMAWQREDCQDAVEHEGGCTESKQPTLNDVINTRAQYLTGHPGMYAPWLRDELDVRTAADLAEAVEDCLGELAKGDGTVGIKPGLEQAFRKFVLASVARGERRGEGNIESLRGSPGPGTSGLSDVGKCSTAAMPKRLPSVGSGSASPSAGRMGGEAASQRPNLAMGSDGGKLNGAPLREQDALEKQSAVHDQSEHGRIEQERVESEKEKMWAEQKRLHLEQQAEIDRLEKERAAKEEAERVAKENEAKEAEKHARAERKRRAKEEREARLAEKAMQEEEERAALERDRQREQRAKREKRAALDAASARANAPPPSLSPAAQPYRPKGLSTEVTIGSNKPKNKNIPKQPTINSTEKALSAPMPQQKQFVLTNKRLSSYIKCFPSSSTKDGISPIFALLQNENTLEKGRALLKLESKANAERNAVAELRRKKESDEKYLKRIISEENELRSSLPERKNKLEERKKNLRTKIADIESGEYFLQRNQKGELTEKSLQEIERKEGHQANMTRMESHRSELRKEIEQIKIDIDTKAHLKVIEKLIGAANKANAVHAELEMLQSKPASILNLLAKTPKQLEEESFRHMRDVYAQIRALDIDAEDGKSWNLEAKVDKIANKMAEATKEMNSINHLIGANKRDTDSKQQILSQISDDRLNAMNEIKEQEDKISEGRNTIKAMESTINALLGVIGKLEVVDENQADNGRKLLLDCTKQIGSIADDSNRWPGKKEAMKKAIEALSKEGTLDSSGTKKEKKETVQSRMGLIRQLLLSQVSEIESQVAKLTELEQKRGETATTSLKYYKWILKSIGIRIDEIEEDMRETPKEERKGIASSVAAMLPTNYFKDKRQKLEKEKEGLHEQRKACQKLVKAYEEEIECEERKVVFNKEVEENMSKLRELEADSKEKENDLYIQVKKFGEMADAIDWEHGWKTRKSGLQSKARKLCDHLEEEEKKAAQIEANWEKRLRDRGEDEKSKEKLVQSTKREIEDTDNQLVTIDGRVEDAAEKILEQKKVVKGNDPKIQRAVERLDDLRLDIEVIKGPKMTEDRNFHIDNSRDERGHTFLMVAAQNNDFQTAQICVSLGADLYAINPERLSAVEYSYFWGFDDITAMILKNGGSLPQQMRSSLDRLATRNTTQGADASTNWDESLKVAETAAVPAETLMECPEACEEDEDKRMSHLTDNEIRSMDFACFEACLANKNINPDQVHRVVLLDSGVYDWCLSSDTTAISNFANVLDGLRPGVADGQKTRAHRRSIIGTAVRFEVFAATFPETPEKEKSVLYSPFVSGEQDGVTFVGVLVWAVSSDSEASMYKTLLSNTEFMRNKMEMDDRFLPHRPLVLELGKDMHLLDLKSTSIWTTSTMDLYILNVDRGDLSRLQDPNFSAKKRIVHSEEIVNKAIFKAKEAETKDAEGIWATERLGMSSVVSGGAGVGKTLLMIRKIAQEDPSRRILMISRLPRLVNIVKTAVDEKRDESTERLTFVTYDDLMQLLARRVVPDIDSEYKSFVRFNHVRFDCDEDNGVSFARQFIKGYLNAKEQKQMLEQLVEPLTLWFAITTIKSHAKCAISKSSLERGDYLALPMSFGLNKSQRLLCYDLFQKYESWCECESFWDEVDRSMYVLKHGPSVFRDVKFIPWAERVNRRGETESLLDEDGEPLWPFFFDMVCADEAQDFTEVDICLFIRMSNTRSIFLNTDPAQSVEAGIKTREGTVNDVFYTQISEKGTVVKDVLQAISLKTNHRTHAENLALGQAIRKILARSFSVPMFHEQALIKGKLPKTLRVKKLSDLAEVVRGGNIVFVAPEEKVHAIRNTFRELGIQNDVFGVREAKGLEFDSVAVLGFFSYFEGLGCTNEWQNVLRWLFSKSGITTTSSTGEKIAGLPLEDCHYTITHPEISEQAMMLYTALTRARNQLYLIEADDPGGRKTKKKKGVGLADFAFRKLSDLKLVKAVSSIDEGQVEMTAAQHKARGVLLVTQALNMLKANEPFDIVRKKFLEAEAKFAPSTGNDRPLLKQCQRHLQALENKRELLRYAKAHFFVNGKYNLENRFSEVMHFGRDLGDFLSEFSGDSFLLDEIKDVQSLVEEIFTDTPYEHRFSNVYQSV